MGYLANLTISDFFKGAAISLSSLGRSRQQKAALAYWDPFITLPFSFTGTLQRLGQ